MDGLSAAASVITVVQLSTQLLSLCEEYIKGVKNAKPDIERLIREISSFQHVLKSLRTIVEDPRASKLFAARTVLDEVGQCESELQKLKNKLEYDKSQRGIRRFGVQALKWPFQSKDVERIVKTLERHKATFTKAVSVDQM